MNNHPCALTLAGSDSGGFAGVQTDLRAFEAFGVHGASVITGVTAQNPEKCEAVFPMAVSEIEAQWRAVTSFFQPAAIKTGLLGSAPIVITVSEMLKGYSAFLTVDPVCVSSSGYQFVDKDALDAYRDRLFPLTSLVTPNLQEAKVFSGTDDPQASAGYFLRMGAAAALVKGGHGVSDWATDFFSDGRDSFYLSSPRLPIANASGTGCTLSAAITAAKALGLETADALVMAKAYLSRALRRASFFKNQARLHQAAWPVEAIDFPRLHLASYENLPPFAPCENPIGFYPIVDRASWVKRLLGSGTRAIQLRIKDLRGEALAKEIREAVRISRPFGAQLFINDYWDLARKENAYGVHLGQEDLASADLPALQKSGLRLGISTHCYAELARALYFKPSYVALGPIFPTTCKSMRFGPQGFDTLKHWAALSDVPVVAIGGLTPEHAPATYEAGARGMAVLSDVLHHASAENRAKEWLQKTQEALG